MSILYSEFELTEKAKRYSVQNNLNIRRFLGRGTQGLVFETAENTALKAHSRFEAYARERDAYLRLRERNIQKIRGLNIPYLANYTDDLFVIEMSIVQPPYLLDFGGAYLDHLPDHATHGLLSGDDRVEEFGARWNDVRDIVRDLEVVCGIYLVDLNTGNIRFGDE